MDGREYEGVNRLFEPWAPVYGWRVIDKSTNKSVLLRARAGDDAQVWALRYDDLENWNSWGGAQQSPPGSPGSVPAIYQTGQSLQETDVVVWYIATVSAVDRIAVCGPWFALEGFPQPIKESTQNGHHAGSGHIDHPNGDTDHPEYGLLISLEVSLISRTPHNN